MAALAAGNGAATAAAWKRFAPMVRHVVRGRLGPSAEVDDAIQEVFLRVFRSIDSVRHPDALSSFVYTIGLRVAHWELRRRQSRRVVVLSPEGVIPDEPRNPADTVGREALRSLWRLLESLNARDRQIFELRHVQQMTLAEVAEATGASLATVKRRLARVVPRIVRVAKADPLLSTYFPADDGPSV